LIVGEVCGNFVAVEEFRRITLLPPYTFNIVREFLIDARERGGDIIDLVTGNPDIPTPRQRPEKVK
jgi:aspartate/methionine/tyrosine aminotransferase